VLKDRSTTSERFLPLCSIFTSHLCYRL
jgi:hypothetical protein